MHIRLKAGQISDADDAKVETAKLEADQAVDMATQALRVAKVGLAFLLGVRGRVPEFHVDEGSAGLSRALGARGREPR